MIFPTRHPVIIKFFEKEFIVMVLSLIPGIHIKGMKSFSKLYEVYMSSAMTMRSYFSTIFANSFIVFSDKQLPDGLDGVLIITAFVLSLMRLSRRPALI